MTTVINPEAGESLLTIPVSPSSQRCLGLIPTGQKLFKTHGNIPIAIIIIPLEDIRHPLQTDTSLNKQIKAHAVTHRALRRRTYLARLAFERLEEHGHKRRAQPIPKGDQRFLKLLQTDPSAAVLVEPVEQLPPRGEVAPQRTELVEIDGPVAVPVEHADHHLDRARVERGVVAVHEGGAQLHLGQRAGVGGVRGAEEGE